MKKTIAFCFLTLCFINSYCQNNFLLEKEKKYNTFIKNLTVAINSKDLKKISTLLSPKESNAMPQIKMMLKNDRERKLFVRILNLKYENSDLGDWERVINYTDNFVMYAIYFSYEKGQWRIAEIAIDDDD